MSLITRVITVCNGQMELETLKQLYCRCKDKVAVSFGTEKNPVAGGDMLNLSMSFTTQYFNDNTKCFDNHEVHQWLVQNRR